MLAAVAVLDFRHLWNVLLNNSTAQRSHNLLLICKFINKRHPMINNSYTIVMTMQPISIAYAQHPIDTVNPNHIKRE